MKYAEAHVRIVSVGIMNIEFICFSALVITAVLLLVIRVYRLPGEGDDE